MSSSSSVEVEGVKGFTRVCVIFLVDENYEIYLVNRDSDEKNVVTNVRPSLRIPHKFGSFRFCVVDGILYAFRIRVDRYSSEEESPPVRIQYSSEKEEIFKVNLSPPVRIQYSSEKEEIFKVNLSRPGMQFADLLEKVPFMCKPKSEGLPLVWGKEIFFFSTLIMFEDCVCPEERENIFDFEVFNTSTLQSVLLPPLLIRRPKNFGALNFYNKVSSQWEDLPISEVGTFPDSFFRIESYSYTLVDIYQPFSIDLLPKFSIQTEFGHMFTINPRMENPCWILGVGGYGGTDKFTQPGLNIIYNHDRNKSRSLVDACGVKYTTGIGFVRKTFCYPFPMSSFDCYRSAINLFYPSPRGMLHSRFENILNTFGIVRVGPDASRCRDEYVPPTTLDWCLDVLKLKIRVRLMESESESESESGYQMMFGGPHMDILKSWKFSTVEKHVVGARVIDFFIY